MLDCDDLGNQAVISNGWVTYLDGAVTLDKEKGEIRLTARLWVWCELKAFFVKPLFICSPA